MGYFVIQSICIMAKQILFEEKARHAIKRGIDQVANAVKVTLGPKGRNVILAKSYGAPQITNDGVTIAKEIELEDKIENLGAEIVKEVLKKPMMWLATAQPLPPCWPKPLLEKALKM